MSAEEVRAFRIRPMEEGDLPSVSAIEKACSTMPWSEEELRKSFENDALYRFYVAEDGDAVIGYLSASVVLDEVNIDNLAVAENARRKGVGRALMEKLLSDALTWGSAAAVLEVRDSNEPAIRLYEGLDFVQIGFRKDYYRNPAEGARIYARRIQ